MVFYVTWIVGRGYVSKIGMADFFLNFSMYLEVRYKFQAWILPKRENEELELHKFFKKLLII